MSSLLVAPFELLRFPTRRIDDPGESLREAAYAELRRVRCRSEEDRLVLEGTVTSFYLKQLAQSILLHQWGNEIPVDNRVEVRHRLERTELDQDCD